jgi:Fe-S-cluster-containing dehydrogenase component/DMSO reductase anchor subunit
MTATAVAIPPVFSADSARQSLDAQAFLAELLGEQQQLTAVERFAQRHAHAPSETPRAERLYRDLLPASVPNADEQYAFEVDLDACSGCTACVTACRQMNGLDEGESFRDVGFLIGTQARLPVVQHVTMACHHCLEPACLTACPVNAYEKDSATGIVHHLHDQCFGCQYCTLACPYDAPKYNRSRGIVRKCDLCSQRLAAGEAPACVQACPHQAIRLRVVRRADVLADCETNLFLPASPEPQHTYPTTNYVSKRPLPRNLIPADHYAVRQEHSHPSLIAMLVLTQFSVGMFAVEYARQWIPGGMVESRVYERMVALLVGLVALAASTLHLGRPHLAYRAVLGLRHSWLSREIVAFGLFAGLAISSAALDLRTADDTASRGLPMLLDSAVVFCGIVGVACSAMIYHSTRRPFWNISTTGLKFILTTMILGAAGVLLSVALHKVTLVAADAGGVAVVRTVLAAIVLIATAAKLVVETLPFANLAKQSHTPLKRSMMLMVGELRAVTKARYVAAAVGMLAVAAFLNGGTSFTATAQAALAGIAFVCLLAGELCERHLFFAAAVAPRMPGGKL